MLTSGDASPRKSTNTGIIPAVEKRIDFSSTAFNEANSPFDERRDTAGKMNICITCVAMSKARTNTFTELYTATCTGPENADKINESDLVLNKKLMIPPSEYLP